MQTDQKVSTLAVRVGASAGLSATQEVTLQLNKPLKGVDRLYLAMVACTNPSVSDLRVEFLGTSVHPLDTYVASIDGAAPTSALYLLVQNVAQAKLVPLGQPQCVVYHEHAHSQLDIHSLRLRITDWQGNPVTFDDLAFMMSFTLAPPRSSNLSGAVPASGAVGPYRDVGRL